MNGIDTTAGMTTAEITLLAAQLGAGVTIIDYFFFPSIFELFEIGPQVRDSCSFLLENIIFVLLVGSSMYSLKLDFAPDYPGVLVCLAVIVALDGAGLPAIQAIEGRAKLVPCTLADVVTCLAIREGSFTGRNILRQRSLGQGTENECAECWPSLGLLRLRGKVAG